MTFDNHEVLQYFFKLKPTKKFRLKELEKADNMTIDNSMKYEK